MTNFEKSLDLSDGYESAPVGIAIAPTIKATALLAVLLVYAAGFAILYPIVQASVSKSASEGNDPTVMEFVSP